MDDQDFVYPIRDPDTILTESRYRPVEHRDWDSYTNIFLLKDIPQEYWQGKMILDVGSGDKYNDPFDTFPGAKVFAIDPEVGERVSRNTSHDVKKGIVQSVPYDDVQFDLILSSWAVPHHIYTVYIPLDVIEMLRVMIPNGAIRLAPCVDRDISNEFGEALLKNGF